MMVHAPLAALVVLTLLHETTAFLLPIPIPIFIVKKFIHSIAYKEPSYHHHLPVYKEVVVKKPDVLDYGKGYYETAPYDDAHYDVHHEAHVEVKKPVLHVEIKKPVLQVEVKKHVEYDKPTVVEYAKPAVIDHHHYDDAHHYEEDYAKPVVVTKHHYVEEVPPKKHYVGGASLSLSVTSH